MTVNGESIGIGAQHYSSGDFLKREPEIPCRIGKQARVVSRQSRRGMANQYVYKSQ
jgi:hypothetical protein